MPHFWSDRCLVSKAWKEKIYCTRMWKFSKCRYCFKTIPLLEILDILHFIDIFSFCQGDALDKYAKKTVKVLVVGNPANTNAFICAKYAPSLPKENFSAMTRLDQNRWIVHSDFLHILVMLIFSLIFYNRSSDNL